ncbi:hypothetical protein AC1031_003658 [Aphanomyces cochlioides]|nr:hypothetical protein AC1031_003658 [Aphanomyces cochlioides]
MTSTSCECDTDSSDSSTYTYTTDDPALIGDIVGGVVGFILLCCFFNKSCYCRRYFCPAPDETQTKVGANGTVVIQTNGTPFAPVSQQTPQPVIYYQPGHSQHQT